jgi:seryl-tRNA(Sec) selenium transferase
MIIAKTKKIKKRILAISIAEPAICVNPNSAAIIAITKNVAAHFNILSSPAYR